MTYVKLSFCRFFSSYECKNEKWPTCCGVNFRLYQADRRRCLSLFIGGSREGDETRGPGPPEGHKNIGVLSNAGPGSLGGHRAAGPVFNVGTSWARRRCAILVAFRWRVDDGPL